MSNKFLTDQMFVIINFFKHLTNHMQNQCFRNEILKRWKSMGRKMNLLKPNDRIFTIIFRSNLLKLRLPKGNLMWRISITVSKAKENLINQGSFIKKISSMLMKASWMSLQMTVFHQRSWFLLFDNGKLFLKKRLMWILECWT